MHAKRSKAVACAICRKHKTRCEVLNPGSARRCHRCDVLGASCSYEANNPVTFSSSEGNHSSPESDAVMMTTSSSSDSGASTSNVSLINNNAAFWTSPPASLPEPPPVSRVRHMWAFIPQTLDWTAPISAIQSLLQQAGPCETLPPMTIDQSLHDILLPAEIEHLIAM